MSLIDWHSEQAKFDNGPYVATVLGLDWVVSKVLGTRPIGDFTDYKAVDRQIGLLEAQLGLSTELQSARDYLVDVSTRDLAPFAYSESVLHIIADRFAQVWSSPIARLLTEFAPYSALVTHREHDDTLTLDFQSWVHLYEQKLADKYDGRASRDYRQLMGRLARREVDPITEEVFKSRLQSIEAIKRGNLAYNVVFQRAYLEAALDFCRIDESHILELTAYDPDDLADFDFDVEDDDAEELEHEPGSEDGVDAGPAADGYVTRVQRRTDEFLSATNHVVGVFPGLLMPEGQYADSEGVLQLFWLGSLVKAEGGIDFTQSASSRAKDLIFAMAAMHLYARTVYEDGTSEFDEFWSYTFDDDAPVLLRRVRMALQRLSKLQGVGARILKSRDEEYDDDAALEEIYWRLRHVWILASL